MLSAALLLFANTLLFSLRLSGGGSFPKPLSAAEEREYLRRYAQGDQAARDILIERNLRLVAHIIKKYYTQSADQEDLISIGTIGLIKGITSFDPEKGARLATYAARCIENEILMYFRSQKKLQGEVSLSDSIDTDKEGNALQLMDVVGVDDTMLEDLHDRDSALRIEHEIRALKEPYHMVSVLYFLEENSIDEIARRLERPPKTVHTQLYRAKQLLKNALERGKG